MPRKGPAKRVPIMPDPIYGNVLIQRFINRVMLRARNISEKSTGVGRQRKKSGKPGIEIFEQAVRNVMPVLEVKPRRVGGATYQVPVEVRPERRTSLALRWLVTNARRRGGYTMVERIAGELMDAANNTGASIKKKEDGHRMADANKAFAHYRY